MPTLLRTLSRLPVLQRLRLRDNAILSLPKARERLVVACQALVELDGKEVAVNERAFLHSLVARQRAASGGTRRPTSRAPPSAGLRGVRAERGADGISRGVSIPADRFEIDFGGVRGAEPQRAYAEDGRAVLPAAGQALPTSARRPWSRTPANA